MTIRKTVRISIHNGCVKADYTGFVGRACEVLDAKIRPAGLQIETTTRKPEYHRTSPQTEHETSLR